MDCAEMLYCNAKNYFGVEIVGSSVCVAASKVSAQAAVVGPLSRGPTTVHCCFIFSVMSSRSVASAVLASLVKVIPPLKSFMDFVAFLTSSIAVGALATRAEVILAACPEAGGGPPSSIGISRTDFLATRRIR
jgi:hypothetical protein